MLKVPKLSVPGSQRLIWIQTCRRPQKRCPYSDSKIQWQLRNCTNSKKSIKQQYLKKTRLCEDLWTVIQAFMQQPPNRNLRKELNQLLWVAKGLSLEPQTCPLPLHVRCQSRAQFSERMPEQSRVLEEILCMTISQTQIHQCWIQNKL